MEYFRQRYHESARESENSGDLEVVLRLKNSRVILFSAGGDEKEDARRIVEFYVAINFTIRATNDWSNHATYDESYVANEHTYDILALISAFLVATRDTARNAKCSISFGEMRVVEGTWSRTCTR